MNTSICFLGTGKMTSRHISVIRKLYPKINLGIASRNEEKAKLLQQKLKVKKSFSSYKQAIASDFNTIFIATPPSSHLSLALACLAKNKNIIIEKPVFNSIDEFDEFLEKKKSSTSKVMVAENHHYHPLHKKIKKALSDGSYGQPIYLEINRLGYNANKGWRLDPKEMPYGALLEGGVHWIRRLNDIAEIFETEKYKHIDRLVAYRPKIRLTNVPNEDTTIVICQHKSGLISKLFHSWGIPRRGKILSLSKIILTKGVIYFDSSGLFAYSIKNNNRKIFFPSLSDLHGFKNMWTDFIQNLEGTKNFVDLTLDDIYTDFQYLNDAFETTS